jgi:hypothetical protein
VIILVLTGAIVFEFARGDDPSPYTWVIAAGGAAYGITLVALRRYS